MRPSDYTSVPIQPTEVYNSLENLNHKARALMECLVILEELQAAHSPDFWDDPAIEGHIARMYADYEAIRAYQRQEFRRAFNAERAAK